MRRFSLCLLTMVALACACLTLIILGLGRIIVIPNNEIMFTATFNNPEMHVYLMDIARQFIVDMKNEDILGYEPAWSPDGRQIAFVGAGTKGFTIYNRNLDRRITQELVHDSGGVYSP